MSVNLFRAFKSINEDKNWIKKMIVGGVLISLCVLMSVFFEDKLPLVIIVDVLIGCYLSGFVFSTMHSQINTKNCELAKWNEKNLLLTGLKTLFALTLFIGVFIAMTVLIGYVSGLGHVPEILLYCVATIWAIVITLIFPVALACYAKDFNIPSILNIKRFFIIFKENPRAVWSIFGWSIVYTILYTIIKAVLSVTMVTVFVLPFVYFYFWLVYANLVVQFAKEVNIKRYFPGSNQYGYVQTDSSDCGDVLESNDTAESTPDAVNNQDNEPAVPFEDTNSAEVSDINDNRTFFEKYEFNPFRLVIAIAAWGILALAAYALFVVPKGDAKISYHSLFILFFVIIPALIYVTKNIFTYKPLSEKQNQAFIDTQSQSNNKDCQE